LKLDFNGVFSGKTVLVTGHTGFKGSWLSLWLTELGAKVVGYALPPETEPSLYEQLNLKALMDSRIGDIRDAALLEKTLRETRPEIVFHLAAQPLVRRSYEQPIETFSVNVIGTANLLEAVRKTESVRVCEVITTDKCYENREKDYAYSEDDKLGGRDPYSASKACAEIVVSSYRDSFFSKSGSASISSTRAGNVIGGGDWAKDRLIPDCARALSLNQPITVRNPRSVRPWQFVLDPLSGYLSLASLQWQEPARYAEAWNFGPRLGSARCVGDVVDLVLRAWGSGRRVDSIDPAAPHEAGLLQLDSSKAMERLKWRPVYDLEESVRQTMAWYRASQEPHFNALDFTRRQIQDYMSPLPLGERDGVRG
jgi:CDP-glucose 4,6-dehydratase